MKILQIMSSTNVNSGVANVIMNYYRAIDKKEVSFDFLVFGHVEVNFNEEIEKLGGKVYYFTKPGLKTYFLARRELKAFFAEHRYDIVHCNEILIARTVFGIARKAYSPVCISHSHNSRLSGYGGVKEIRNRILVRGLAKISDHCFACSKQAAVSAFGKHILQDKKLQIIPNAINLDKYKFTETGREKIRKEFGLTDEYVLCDVGRLSGQKNQSYLLQIMQKLKQNGEKYRLIIAGDGEMRDQVRKEVRDRDLTKDVIMTGVRNDVADILSASDLFVFPSVFEGLGLALVEAQANGLKCVATDTLPEEVFIEDNVTGVSLDDSEKWADCIRKIACGGYDRKEVAKKVFGSDFEINNAAEKLLQTYKTIEKSR